MLELHQLKGSGRVCMRNVASAPRGRPASARPAERPRGAGGVGGVKPPPDSLGSASRGRQRARRAAAAAAPARPGAGLGSCGRAAGPEPAPEPAPGRPCGASAARPRVAAASGVVPRRFRCCLKKRVRSSWSSLLAHWKGYRVEAPLVQPK